jgi:hypothetical protein
MLSFKERGINPKGLRPFGLPLLDSLKITARV